MEVNGRTIKQIWIYEDTREILNKICWKEQRSQADIIENILKNYKESEADDTNQ